MSDPRRTGDHSGGVTGKPQGVRQPVYVVFTTVEANLHRRTYPLPRANPGSGNL
jgi:hypothetical protein